MRTILTVLIISLSLTSLATCQDFFPLYEGNQWTYTMSNGIEMTMKVTGFTDVEGVRCAVVESFIENSAEPVVSEEYLAVDSEGLKAYMAQMQGQEFVYDPPVLRIKLPFQKEQSWTATMEQAGMPVITSFKSERIQEVSTRTGNFSCIVISSSLTIPGQGTVASESYYSDGVGLILQKMQAGGQTITTILKSYNVKPTEQNQDIKCPFCGAAITANTKFCPSCGKEIPRAALPPPAPQLPTVCPNCGAKIPEGAKFCPQCGEEIKIPSQTGTTIIDVNEEKKLEKYLSPMGTLMLYKPHSWEVVEQNIGEGIFVASIMRPDETAVVVFMTFPVRDDIDDSVKLASACLKEFKDEIPDLEGKNIKSTQEKDKTIMDISFTEEGEKGVGHGYFFYTNRIGTVYLLLARDDLWEQTRPVLINISSNIAYSPQKITNVVKQGQELAAQTTITTQERVLNPAAMLQKAKKSTGKQLQLVPASLPDGSLALQIPQDWIFQGQELQFSLTESRETKNYGISSVRYTIIPSEFSIPNVLNAPYQPPPQALKLAMEFNKFGTKLEILADISAEQALPETAQSVQTLRAQGYQVDARLIHVKFQNMLTNKTMRGIFSVQCMTMPMSTVWQVSINGSWAPDDEFDEWLPLYLRIGDTAQVNQQWLQADLQNRSVIQRQLNRNLQNSIAGANQAFDEYMDSLQNADRSRDYTSWMWSQTTLGQGTWVAKNEGAEVYQTDSYGIEGPQGRIDSPAYNTTNFTGVSPWNQDQLELIDTRSEFEQYMSGN